MSKKLSKKNRENEKQELQNSKNEQGIFDENAVLIPPKTNKAKTLSKISIMCMCFCYFYEYFNDYPTPPLLRSLSLLIVFNLLIRVLALLLLTS